MSEEIKHLTAEAAIEAAKKDCGLIEFDGMNCNDWLEEDESECGGWDGHDRRCECGNRRVYWDAYGDEETGFIAHGRAD